MQTDANKFWIVTIAIPHRILVAGLFDQRETHNIVGLCVLMSPSLNLLIVNILKSQHQQELVSWSTTIEHANDDTNTNRMCLN